MQEIKQFMLKPWLYLVIVLAGTSLKLYHIDYHIFWYDEICTIQHTSGNQILDIPVNEIKNISYYDDQLHLKKQNLSIGSELKGLYGSTNLNPLHYNFLMLWYRIAGDDIISYRLFNVFIFILTLPILFLLAKKLFKSNLAGYIAVSLYSVAPLFHYFVHEARYNTLVVFVIILLHYFFLQAIDQKKIKWWIGYSLIGVLALYASVLSGLIIFGHFVYIIFLKKDTRIIYSINLLIILACYLPWIISIYNNISEINDAFVWHGNFGRNNNSLLLLLYQLIGFSHIFVHFTEGEQYFGLFLANKFEGNIIQLISDIIVLSFIISSIIYTIKKAPGKVAYFLIFIVLPYVLFFYISDTIRNTGASLLWRYHLIIYSGVMLFVVYLLYRKIALGKLFYSGIYLGLIIVGFISIISISNTRSFIGSNGNIKIQEAQFFSKAGRPLLITDFSMSSATRGGVENFTVILNECQSQSIDILRAAHDIKNVDKMLLDSSYTDIYVTRASSELVENLKMQFGEKMEKQKGEGIPGLWQIKY